jgi:trans-aconitate methyltransferase
MPTNPWLSIPIADYEGHMDSPGVAQLAVLSELFAEVLERERPASVAVLGVAGGNGLSRIDRGLTTRIAGLDLNPAYLDAVRQRYPDLPGLELHRVDLSTPITAIEPVSLVHAALVLEHTDAPQCLENAASLVARGGRLSVVLQLPGAAELNVAPSGFASMQALAAHFRLIHPGWVQSELVKRSFRLDYEITSRLASDKTFWMGVFDRDA